MHTLNIPQIKQLVSHIAIAQNEPVMLWGPPGCGKSEGIAQVAKEEKLELIDIRVSQYDSVDFRGVPNIDGRTTVWNLPATMPFKGNPNFDENGPGYLLFLDELNSGTPPVLAVCYQLINDKRCGEHILMKNVRVVAAGNREGDRGVTTRMPTPLANRFTHAEVTTDPDAWCFWAQEQGLPPIFIAFIQFRKNLLDRFALLAELKESRRVASLRRNIHQGVTRHAEGSRVPAQIGRGQLAYEHRVIAR